MTDPLLHTTLYGYDTQGRLTSVTNALGKTWSVNPDSSGRPRSITSPAPIGATTNFGYSGADLITVTDPLNRVTTRAPDGAGRLVSLQDALGNQTLQKEPLSMFDPRDRCQRSEGMLQLAAD